jgi:hypothetical protein
MQELAELTKEGGWAAEKAELIIQIKEQFDSGSITVEECKELLADIARCDDIEENADNMTKKAMLVYAISGISAVI